jgi:caspase 6
VIAFLCVFLSHGEGSHIYTYDTKIEIQTLTGLFTGDKCQSLVGKPKIFTTQACQGDQHDVPVIPLDVEDHETDKQDNTITDVMWPQSTPCVLELTSSCATLLQKDVILTEKL